MKTKKDDLLKLTVKRNFLSSIALVPLTPCEYKCVLVAFVGNRPPLENVQACTAHQENRQPTGRHNLFLYWG
jgi:hypothetical protein